MLVNVSNHPSEKWGTKQLETAKAMFGEIVNVPFPNIDPHMDSNDLTNFAHSFVEEKLSGYTKSAVTFHIMGEQVFSFRIIDILYRLFGADCVASTSERIVTENEDGTKTVKFEFVQFRSYFE